jgi:replication-associated recombination protein RarA
MSRFTEKHRPQRLADIVGQPPIRILQRFVQDPYQRCFLFEGPGGVGKTTAAFALANELNVHDFDLHVVIGSEFSIDKARDLWHGPLQNRPMNVGSWKVVLIEEMEFLSQQCCTFLKTGLETKMPPSTIVVATSNNSSKLPGPLLQRFDRYTFRGDLDLLTAAQPLLKRIWQQEAPDAPMPSLMHTWGYQDGQYSVRRALMEMQDMVELTCN